MMFLLSMTVQVHLLFAFVAQAADAIDVSSLLSQLLAAWHSHSYVLVGGLVINALVALAKQGWLSSWLASKLPSRFLPYVATVLGVLGTSSAELIAGKPWQQALLDGIASAMTAVFVHEAVVQAARGGKELVPATEKVSLSRQFAAKTDPNIGPAKN